MPNYFLFVIHFENSQYLSDVEFYMYMVPQINTKIH